MNKIEQLYDRYDEENRLLRSRESKVESDTTVKYLAPHMKNKKVLEVGCGTGYYCFYFKDVYKSYMGIDISERNIKVFQKTIDDLGIGKKAKCKVDDGLDLTDKDETYDVVLNLGPLYHFDEENVHKCVQESIRVCKPGGILAFSYMNKFGNFVKLCAQDTFVGRYPTEELLYNMLNKNIDDEELFYFTTPEKIEEILRSHDLEILHNLTTDGTTMHHQRISDFSDHEFELWMKFHLATCEEPSIRGLGDHGLVICRKKK